jgi:IS30 family transposase
MAKTYVSISYSERIVIEQLIKQGFGVRGIARTLNRSTSTISTELRRNGMSIDNYSVTKSEKHAKVMRKSLKPKEKMHGALEAMTQQLLIEYHCSPSQISGYLKKQYPDQTDLHISHQTIYSYIRHPSRAHLLKKYLRRKGRKPRNRQLDAKRERIKNMKLIGQRPQEVENREIPGHWEGDLIVGKNNGSVMGTLVERSSRYTIVVPLERRDSQTVVDAFIEKLSKFPEHLRKSLTYDQGIEMAFHEKITSQLKMPVYFAEAASPWQRGSNENTNGLLREFFPKKTDLNKYSHDEIQKVQDTLNKRPRNILEFSTPKKILEAFLGCIKTTLSQVLC